MKRWLVVALALALAPRPAAACVCRDAFAPACALLPQADAVFLGEVTSLEVVGDVRRARFAVHEPYRGVATRVVDVETSERNTCGLHFRAGERWLVFAEKDQGLLRASYCGGSRPQEKADEALAYLRSPDHLGMDGSVIGLLIWRARGQPEPLTRLAGVDVTMQGGGFERTVSSDASGRFRAGPLPPGRYHVASSAPSGLELLRWPTFADVQLGSVGCASSQLVFASAGRVRGRVVDAEGEPLVGLAIRLHRVEAGVASRLAEGIALSDEQGQFDLEHVDPGRYLVGAGSYFDARSPYPPWYHSGGRREDATPIEVGLGEERILDLHLPPRPGRRSIELAVVWPDGRPARGASVAVGEARSPFASGQGLTLGPEAEAVFEGFEGLRYVFSAHFTWPGGRQAHAEPVEAPADLEGPLRLVISQPGGSCSRCRWKPAP